MEFIDTHIHLQDYKARYTTEIISAAQSAGVCSFICCSTSPQDWGRVASLADEFASVVTPAFGLHPWYISSSTGEWEAELAQMLSAYPHALIGECGLDGIKNPAPEPQLSILRRHIALAHTFHRPLLIHSVKAQSWFERIWKELPPCFVFHSFSGSLEFARQIIKSGGYITFSFSIMRHHHAAELIKTIPLSRLLFETDGPYQPPHKGEETAAETLPELAAFVASHRPETRAEVFAAVYHNSLELINYAHK